MQRAGHLGLRKARQDVDDVQPRDGILAVQTADELGQIVVRRELAQDAEERGLLVRLLLVGGGEDFAHGKSGAMRGDHVEQRGLRDAFGVERVEQHGRGIGAAAGQCPGDTRDDARTAGNHGFDEPGERFLS